MSDKVQRALAFSCGEVPVIIFLLVANWESGGNIADKFLGTALIWIFSAFFGAILWTLEFKPAKVEKK